MKTKSFLLAACLLGLTSAVSAQTITVAKLSSWEHPFFTEYLAALERHMGATFKIVEVASVEQKRQLLEEGKVDFFWERRDKETKAVFRWSRPLCTSELSLLIRKSEAKGLKDLKGKPICSMPFAHSQEFVERLGAKMLTFTTPAQMFENLLAKRCVAMVSLLEINLRLAREHPELKKTFKHYKKAVNPPMFQFAFAMKKSNKALQKQLNRAIQKTVEDGSYREILNRYVSKQP